MESVREQIERAYTLSALGTNVTEIDALLSGAGNVDSPITVIEIDRLRDDARSEHDAYLAAITAATTEAGGTVYAVCDIVEPGTGDLLPYLNYSGGVASLLSFPSRAAYLTALGSQTWQAGLPARNAAVVDAVVLVAGDNEITPMMSAMFGEPRPASDFPTPHVDGKTPEQLVDELLTIYPDGGADPAGPSSRR